MSSPINIYIYILIALTTSFIRVFQFYLFWSIIQRPLFHLYKQRSSAEGGLAPFSLETQCRPEYRAERQSESLQGCMSSKTSVGLTWKLSIDFLTASVQYVRIDLWLTPASRLDSLKKKKKPIFPSWRDADTHARARVS